MKKTAIFLLLVILLTTNHTPAFSKTINEADTDFCDTLKYALINSLREPITKAITEIYKDDPDAPAGITWASYQTQILKIEQLNGVGGAYTITFKVSPYYRAHITYGEDIVVVSADGVLVDYRHVKTFPKVSPGIPYM